jgi:hypothetical protein
MERVEREIRDLAFFDPRKLILRRGWGKGRPPTFTLRQFAELPAEVAAAVASYDVVEENLSPSDGKQEQVIRVRWYDKREMLALLAKHFGYVTDKVTVGIEPELRALLEAGRQRNAARLAGQTMLALPPAPEVAVEAEVIPTPIVRADDLHVPRGTSRTRGRRKLRLSASARVLAQRALHTLENKRRNDEMRASLVPPSTIGARANALALSDSDLQLEAAVDIDPPPPEI